MAFDFKKGIWLVLYGVATITGCYSSDDRTPPSDAAVEDTAYDSGTLDTGVPAEDGPIVTMYGPPHP